MMPSRPGILFSSNPAVCLRAVYFFFAFFFARSSSSSSSSSTVPLRAAGAAAGADFLHPYLQLPWFSALTSASPGAAALDPGVAGADGATADDLPSIFFSAWMRVMSLALSA